MLTHSFAYSLTYPTHPSNPLPDGGLGEGVPLTKQWAMGMQNVCNFKSITQETRMYFCVVESGGGTWYKLIYY